MAKSKAAAKKKCSTAKKALRSAKKALRKTLKGKVGKKKMKTVSPKVNAYTTAQKNVNDAC